MRAFLTTPYRRASVAGRLEGGLRAAAIESSVSLDDRLGQAVGDVMRERAQHRAAVVDLEHVDALAVMGRA